MNKEEFKETLEYKKSVRCISDFMKHIKAFGCKETREDLARLYVLYNNGIGFNFQEIVADARDLNKFLEERKKGEENGNQESYVEN